jgi:hypothetical protein
MSETVRGFSSYVTCETGNTRVTEMFCDDPKCGDILLSKAKIKRG